MRTGIHNAGFSLPPKRLTVDLTPASLPKHGTATDLGLAVALLSVSDVVPPPPEGVVFLGELGLDGRQRPVTGILPAAQAAVDAGFTSAAVPAGNAAEATTVTGLAAIPAADLAAVVSWITTGNAPTLPQDPPDGLPRPEPEPFAQLRDVPGPAELIPVLRSLPPDVITCSCPDGNGPSATPA